jgi:hypothetical protein
MVGPGNVHQVPDRSPGQVDGARFLRVEDAPATRSEADYNFISNEIFVRFTPPIARSGRPGLASCRRAASSRRSR